jgi:hypothetical protein
MHNVDIVLLGMSIVALIGAYFLNKLDVSKWENKLSNEKK